MATKRAQEESKRDARIRAALASWESLNEVISDMDEEDVLHAMKVEQQGADRKSFQRRLTQRLHGIRMAEINQEVADKTEEVLDGNARKHRRRD